MFVLRFFILTTFVHIVFSQGVGKVFIGTLPGNISESLVYGENADSTFLVPVYIENKNPADGTDVPINGNVNIQCELSITGSAGFSSATFSTTLILTNAVRAGNVQFSNARVGQAVDIRCYGVSVSDIQFNRTESISTPSTFRITRAPTVSICPTGTKDFVAINQQNVAQNITVRLSEAVVTSAVTVTCTGAGLIFGTAVAGLGAREIQVTVTMTTSNSVTASCNGQSASGGQYRPANSRGPAVSFQVLQPRLVMYPQSLSVTTTSFSLLLLLTSAPSGTRDFRCRADLLQLSDVNNALVNPLCQNPSTTVPPTTGNGTDPINVAPAWGILSPEVTLLPTTTHAVLRVARNIDTSSAVEENIVVSCCNVGGTTLRYAVWAKASLTPNATINWDKSTSAINFTTPRTIQNVAFVEIAPCPCDLNDNKCDINCCCDGDCTATEKETFSQCIPYLEGGQDPATPEYMCKSDHYRKEDWFPLMCVTSEYNSLLGFFYTTETNIRTKQGLNEKISNKIGFSYQETENRIDPPASLTPDPNSPGYQLKDKVLSVKTSASGLPERRGVVSLPQRILSGECSTAAPVEYLRDVDSDCSFEMTAQMCSDNSVFNALSYMLSSTTTNPSCPSSFSVMGNSISQNVAETIVNYYCVTDTSSYIKSTTILPQPSTRSLFNYVVPSGCPQDICGREDGPSPPCTGYDDSTTPEVLPPRCGFNDQYTLPSRPVINGANCQNAVVDVRYNFFWSGSSILKLNASVFLATIPLSTSAAPVVVTQKYKAAFLHSFSGQSNATQDNYYNVGTTFARSGKPGYDLDKPVISGMAIRNVTDNSFLYMNSNSSRRMALWDTGFDGLCFNAGRKEIPFGRDTFTSCNLYIGTADLANCSGLNKLIINRLDNLMPAERIGRYGNNNPYALSQWVEVLREDLNPTCTNSLQANNQTVLSWNFAGFCTDIVSGINLDILYGESGKADNVPTKEIIGASISYTKSTWQLLCGSGSSSRCSDPNYVEPFQVTASVRFIRVPANTPEPKIRWKEENPDICFRDVCWENFLYPLEKAYTAEPRQYVLAMVLVLILFIIGFLFITRPWW